MYKKLRNFGTVPLGVTNLVSIGAGNLKEKKSFGRCRVIARNVKGGGGHDGPPVLLGLSLRTGMYTVFAGGKAAPVFAEIKL